MPTTIIRDQDQLIVNAIKATFSILVRTFYCSYLNNLSENRWTIFLQNQFLQGTEILCKDFIDNIRIWTKVLDTDIFHELILSFLSTTGRSESTNALFKGYVTQKDTIVNFFDTYENI